MMITISRFPDWSADVVVDAEPSTSVRDVVKGLLDSPALTAAPAVTGPAVETPAADKVYLGGRLLDLDQPLAGSGIKDGVVLWLDQPGPVAGRPGGLVTLRAVAGVGAGQVWYLHAGEHHIGVDPAGALVVDGEQPEAAVAVVRVSLDARVRVRTGAGPALLDREPLPKDEVRWLEHAQLSVSETVLEVRLLQRPDAVVAPSADGGYLDYNRPPRLLPPARRTAFKLPSRPKAPTLSALPWLATALPAVFGGAMAMMLHNAMYLMMAGMSPVMMVGTWYSGRRQGRIGHRRQLAEYQEQLEATETGIAAALEQEQRDRRVGCPDPAELLVVATGPRARLWERRRTDPDHLLVRVGTADLPTDIVVEEGDAAGRGRELRAASDVPAAFSIAQAGVVGVAGRDEWPRRTTRWLVGQLAVLQSPRDVQIYILTDPAGESLWEWATWLPHTRPLLGQQALALVGADAETLGHRVAELGELIKARRQARLNAGPGAASADPEVIVVMDGARRLRALPGVVTILQEGPAVGVMSICVDADERTLPEECTTVVAGGSGQRARLRRQREAELDAIRADEVADSWFEAVGRGLAPLRDVSEGQGDAALPGSARLLEILGLEQPTAGAIASHWRASGRSTKAVVGYSLDGPFALDLVNHGPHGLVAGTTGSGKSEFLQTLVASLAVANRPDAMTFVLVDYKGGAAFKDCVDLPHTVGLVTDLDTHLVERALVSLSAELTHREHLLAGAGAKDLEDYLDYAERRPGELAPIPRLLIVIDEFASMVRELPDFVTGLVNVAQRGRSLGIHLILATQRPSGVVSAEIRANTNLRVALRVTDQAESTDVIDAREAAGISAATPGRAYARLGHSSLIPFQTGRVGGRRPLGDRETVVVPPFLQPVSWLDLGRPAPQRPRGTVETDTETDLAALVRAVEQANSLLGLAPQRRPWLPPLPLSEVVELPVEPVRGKRGEPVFSWAVQDLPTQQRQEAVTVDLATFGHLHIIGAPRSGRSTALRTIAATAAAASGVTDLHLYGLDCGNGALLPLSRLPHCGAVVQRSEPERVARLLNRLHAEVLKRQRVLGEGGFADLAEQRSAAPAVERLPHVMLLLDRWEGFMGTLSEYDGGALTELIHTLHREGASAGVHLVIAGDQMLLSGRMGSLTEEKLVLRLADRTDASLAGLSPRKIPEHLPPGRGFRAPSAIETQVGLVAADPAGPAQVAALHALGARLVEREAAVPKSARPNRIAVLPTQLSFEQAWELVGTPSPMWALLGVGGDELEPVGADLLGDQPTFLVAGPSRSGRSTALCVMTESLLRGGAEVVLGAPMNSPLRAFAGRAGVRGVLTAEAPTEVDFAELLDPGDGPVVLLVDDAEAWRDLTCRDWLKAFVRKAAGSNRAVILGGDVATVASGFSGWQAEVKRNRRGALLSPANTSDGDLVGTRLSRSQLATRVVPGSALVHLGTGSLTTAQIPLAAPAPTAHPSEHPSEQEQ